MHHQDDSALRTMENEGRPETQRTVQARNRDLSERQDRALHPVFRHRQVSLPPTPQEKRGADRHRYGRQQEHHQHRGTFLASEQREELSCRPAEPNPHRHRCIERRSEPAGCAYHHQLRPAMGDYPTHSESRTCGPYRTAERPHRLLFLLPCRWCRTGYQAAQAPERPHQRGCQRSGKRRGVLRGQRAKPARYV